MATVDYEAFRQEASKHYPPDVVEAAIAQKKKEMGDTSLSTSGAADDVLGRMRQPIPQAGGFSPLELAGPAVAGTAALAYAAKKGIDLFRKPATVNEAATQEALAPAAPEAPKIDPHTARMQDIEHQRALIQLEQDKEKLNALKIKNNPTAATTSEAPATPAPQAPQATPEAAPQSQMERLQQIQTEAAAANAAKPTAPVVPEAPVAEAPKAIPELAGPAPELVGPKQAIAPPVETKAAIPPMIGPSPETPTVLPPEGWREQPTTNKVKGEVVGRGAFNHLANNIGIEAARKLYQEVYGGKNVVSYDQMIEEMQKISGPPKPLPEGAKPGGSFGRPKYIPPEIKGSTTLEGVSSLANAAIKGLFGLDVARQVKQGIEEKDTPKIVNALGSLSLFNPLTAILGGGLVTPPEDEEKIKKMIYKEKVGAGRGTQGVPPP